MAPINLPNGTEVSEIVLPNGATASEVIAPDGSTVFGAIPDSAIHQWLFKEGSGNTVTDEIGTADGTLDAGISWVSGTWREGFALDGDGSSQVTLTTLDDFATALGGQWYLAITYQSTNDGLVFGSSGSSNDAGLTTESGYGAVSGAFNWRENTGGNSTIRVHTDSSSFSDGNKYRVVINQTGTTASDIEIWVNGSEEPVTVDMGGPTNSAATFDTAFSFFNINGNPNPNSQGTLDAPELGDGSLTQSQIQNDYNRQPWS